MIDDDWYDKDDDTPPREEPYCDQCCDRRAVPTGRLLRLVRIRNRGCPSCNPDWITYRLAWLRPWRIRAAVRRLRHPFTPPVYTDEAPF